MAAVEPPLPDEVDGEGRFVLGATSSVAKASILLVLAAVVQTVVLARALGPTGKGELYLAQLTATTIALVLSCSLGSALQVALGRGEIGPADAARFVARFAAVLAGPVLLVGGLAAAASDRDGVLLATAALVPFEAGVIILQPAFVSARRVRRRNQIDVTMAVVTLGMVMAAITVADDDVVAALAAFTGARAVHLVVYNRVLATGGSVAAATAGPLFAFGLRQHAATVLARGMKRLDAFFIAGFLGADAVGVYSVASGLAELPMVFARAAHPAATAVSSEDDGPRAAAAVVRAQRATLGLFSVGLPMFAVAFAVCAGPIFGDEYLGARAPMAILLVSTLGLSTYVVLSGFLVGSGDPGALVRAMAGPLALNVVLSLTLIPAWGLVGNAVASATASLLTAVISIRQFVRRTGTRAAELVTPDLAGATALLVGDRNGQRGAGSASSSSSA